MPELATPFSQIKKIQRRNLECKEAHVYSCACYLEIRFSKCSNCAIEHRDL